MKVASLLLIVLLAGCASQCGDQLARPPLAEALMGCLLCMQVQHQLAAA